MRRPAFLAFVLAAGCLGPCLISTRLQCQSISKTESTPTGLPDPATAQPLTAAQIAMYQNTQTLIDWIPSQIHRCPFLHGLRPAAAQEQLPEILQRVAQSSMCAFDGFPNVFCDEEVLSESSTSHSRVRREFHYIVIRRGAGDVPAFEEYRTDPRGDPVSGASFWNFSMLTWNFASTFLFFSPADQRADRYRYLGNEVIRGRESFVVGFAQDPQKVCRPDVFYTENTKDVVLLQGLGWIDAQTSQVLRVMTFLVAPRKDIGLDSQTTTVDFFPVRPLDTDAVLWLPRDVRVETLYRGIKMRNVHHYSNFKLFRVKSAIKAVP